VQRVDAIEAAPSRLAKAADSLHGLALPCVLAAGAALLFAGLGNRDFWPPDEPRYGAIAEELRSFAHGLRGLVLLHLNGAVYTQKPPLFFWLAALVGAPFGRVSEAAARLPSALAGFATLLLVAGLARSMFRARSGALAAAVLLTVPSWLQLARSARLDALLTAFVTLAFAAAWRLDREIGDTRRNRLLLHAAIGLGVLTKGPVALLLPLLGVAAYLGWERRLFDMRRFVSAPGLLLSVAPGLAWLASASLLAPEGYASASLWDNVILRFFSGTAHAQPVWFYLESLPRGFLPWTLLWPVVGWRYRTSLRESARGAADTRAWRFLLASIGAAFVFFSLSAGKRGLYLLPLHPLLAIACGEALAAWLDDAGGVPRWLRRSLAAAAGAVVLAGLGSLVFGHVGEVELPASFGLLLAGGAASALLAERALRMHARQRIAFVAAGLGLLFAVELAVQVGLYPALDARNSQRAIAELASAATPDGGAISVYGNDTLAAAVAYYAGRPVRELRAARQAAAFFAEGGAAIVIEDEHLAELGRTPPLREVGQGRSRQRRFLVMVPEVRGADAR
jgi:4-amino-4-deoxy-L-arabinose transferase-like glycosyltransferase